VPIPPSDAARTWAAVKDTTTIAVLEEFRRQYGAANPVYDRLAWARIEELRKQQIGVTPVAPVVKPTPPPTAAAPKPEPPPVVTPKKALSQPAPRKDQECFTFNEQKYCN
jgi:hypothetical protein